MHKLNEIVYEYLEAIFFEKYIFFSYCIKYQLFYLAISIIGGFWASLNFLLTNFTKMVN